MAHSCELVVRFNECDPYNHVNHATYLTYFEVARTEALEACGIPIGAIGERGLQLVVTSVEVRYRRSAGVGDRLRVETWLGEMKRASGVWQQRICCDEAELVTAAVTIAVTDGSGRPTRPPGWLLDGLGRL